LSFRCVGGARAEALYDFEAENCGRSSRFPLSSGSTLCVGGARAEALYDFEAENATELPFHEGDVIALLSRIDDNWYEGSLGGRTGLFPVTYVRVISDLP